MRIGHLAAAADTTPRAVRHYHRLGLLPEPARTAGGYRDYTMADLARLMRIRWLADSGVPLGAISVVLGDALGDRAAGADPGRDADADSGADVRADLADLVERSAQHLEVARRRHDRLVRMLDAAETGRPLSPLPAELIDLLEAAERECDPVELRTLHKERDLIEVLALAGTLPDALLDWSVRVLGDPELRRAYRELLRGWDRLEGRAPQEAEQEISELAEQFSAWMARDPKLLEAMGVGGVVSAAEVRLEDGLPVADLSDMQLTVAQIIPDPAQRRMVERTLTLLYRGSTS